MGSSSEPPVSVFNKIILPFSEDFSKYKNICFISSIVEDSNGFSQYLNGETYPVIYNSSCDRESLKTSLLSQFVDIERISFVFHGPTAASDSTFAPTRFVNDEMFFTIDEINGNVVVGENHVFLQEVCHALKVKHVDFMACNLLQCLEWQNYFALFQNVVVGASIDNTGNLMYGGNWVMENTMENVRDLYFDNIDDFTGLLINYTVVVNGSNRTLTYTLDANNNVSITGIVYPGLLTLWPDVVVPSFINGNPVTTIAYIQGYYYTLVIPDGVTKIGTSAIENGPILTTVTLPSSLTYIGDYAFSQNRFITSILLPPSLTYIGSHAFWLCAPIVFSGSIPATVKTIGDSAFDGCQKLVGSITIPGGLTYFGADCFASTSISEVTIGRGITTIPNQAFYSTSNLASIHIPNTVTTINIRAFAFAGRSIPKAIVIPSSVISIGPYAFQYCGAYAVYFCGKTIPALLLEPISYPYYAALSSPFGYNSYPLKTYYLSTVTNVSVFSGEYYNNAAHQWIPLTASAMFDQMKLDSVPLLDIYNAGFLAKEFIKTRYTLQQLVDAGISVAQMYAEGFVVFAELANLNTYYNTFYTVSATTPTVMTRTIYDNVGTLLDTIDISFGGQNITDTLAIMNSTGNNPFTIGIVDSPNNKIQMDLAYCDVFTKALTTNQKTKLMTYVNATYKEPHTAAGPANTYIVTVSGGTFRFAANNGAIAPTVDQSLLLTYGQAYIFDQSDSSNTGYQLTINTNVNNTVRYTTGIITNNTPGSLNAYTLIDLSSSVAGATLFYGLNESVGGNLYTSAFTSIALFSTESVSVGETFEVTFYSGLPAGTSVGYTISGCTSANLNNASLSNTFTSPSQVIQFQLVSSIVGKIFFNILEGPSASIAFLRIYTVKVVTNIMGKTVFAIKAPYSDDFVSQPSISFVGGEIYKFYVTDLTTAGYSLVFGTTIDVTSSIISNVTTVTSGNSIVLNLLAYSGGSLYYFESTRAGMGYVNISEGIVKSVTTSSFVAPSDYYAKLITCSRDGKYVYIISQTMPLSITVYRSLNYGKTYSYINITTLTSNGVVKIVTYDGKNIIISNNTELYVSHDFGFSFSNVSLIQFNFTRVSRLIATPNLSSICLISGGYVYVSRDKGTTWNKPLTGSYKPATEDIAISDSGQYLVFSLNGGFTSQISVSNDYGQNVTNNPVTGFATTTEEIYGRKLYMSANGQICYAFGGGGPINKNALYTSNYGATWSDFTNGLGRTGGFDRDKVSLSYDGTNILYKDNYNNEYPIWSFSNNSGASFAVDMSYGYVHNEACIADEGLFIYANTNTSFYSRFISSSTYKVTVVNNKFSIRKEPNTTTSENLKLTFASGKTYAFDQSDPSNTGNTFVLGTFPDSLSSIISYQTVVGTPGQPGAYTTFTSSGELLYYFSYQQMGMGYQTPETYAVNIVQNPLGQNIFAVKLPGSDIFIKQPILEFTTGNIYMFDVSNLTGYSLVFGTTIDVSSSIISNLAVRIGNMIKLDLSDFTGSKLYYFENTRPNMGYAICNNDTTIATTSFDFPTTFSIQKVTRSRNGQYVYVYGITSGSTHSIMRSSDYGVSFNTTPTILSTPFEYHVINTIKTDSGQYIMARVIHIEQRNSTNTGVYLSSDYGATFSFKNFDKAWSNLMSTTNGQYLCGTYNLTQIFSSSDYGITWRSINSGQQFFDVCISDDGQYMMGPANSNTDCAFVSNDFGATFQFKKVTGYTGLPTIARTIFMSGNGKFAYIFGAGGYQTTEYNNNIFTNDYGNTWNRFDLPGSPSFRTSLVDCVRFSYNGQYQYYIENAVSKLYYLDDGGSTFKEASNFSRTSDICIDDNSNVIAAQFNVNNYNNKISKVDVTTPNYYFVRVSGNRYTFTSKYGYYFSGSNIVFEPSKTYVLDQSDSSNVGNTIVLKDSSSNIITYQTLMGSPGQPGAYTTFTTTNEAVYYFSYETAGFDGG